MNSIQLFGCLLIGGLAAGETTRRALGLPRTTGYVAFGLVAGKSGLGWVETQHIESARLFIDLALGLILFELGHRLPARRDDLGRAHLWAGLAEALLSGILMFAVVLALGFPAMAAAFAAAIGISTSPAITIATSSDVGAKGPKTETLFTLVAINGSVAFVLLALLAALSGSGGWWGCLQRLAAPIAYSLSIGVLGAILAVAGARRLGRHAEHQHLLLLGIIVLAVGNALALGVSVLLPLLCLGVATRLLDRDQKVVAIRISSDARIFLVITFVLAGAALDVRLLARYWEGAAFFLLARWVGKMAAVGVLRRHIGLGGREGPSMAIGLMPMSSVALVLLSDVGGLYAQTSPDVHGTLLAAILLMQLLGPPATQFAIREFGEATLLPARRKGVADQEAC